MSDIDQLLEVVRKMDAIKADAHELQKIPVDQRDDNFYKAIAWMSLEFDQLEADRAKLAARIPQGEKFLAWLTSYWK